MNNRFIVALDNGAPAQQDAITGFLKERDFQFWHWIEDLWLLSDVPVGISPKKLWEELNALPSLKGKGMVVLSFNHGITYWGELPESAWGWLSQYWGTPL